MFSLNLNGLVNVPQMNLISKAHTKNVLPGTNVLALICCLFAALALTGCASTKVATNPQMSANEKLPKPSRVVVYNFNPGTVGYGNSSTALQAEIGREIAQSLVHNIREMGLPATLGSPGAPLETNDILIKGSVLSVDEGDAAKRVALGFGSGSSELKVQVEGYQMTSSGLRKLGSGTGNAGGSSTPGAAMGAVGAIATANPAGFIVSTGMKVYGEASGSSKVEGRTKDIVQEISDRLKTRFQQQGWVK
ncbi:MAG: DUF4410 domain-containing protein [Methylobacter sp.]